MRRRYADLAREALLASAAKRPRHETPALFGRDCNLLLWPEMLREAIGKVWKMLPKAARLRLVRATQTTFTVSVAAIVINEKREVLLLNHVLRPKSGWGFPGGFLDAGEQTHEAIRREVK
ncbi:MAG TPA: NUDIX hydrolase, partial [Pyrinomonadaceae bacterium]|nr:NUDIX hydrolase [Pyrinomonadaceae bacterium]